MFSKKQLKRLKEKLEMQKKEMLNRYEMHDHLNLNSGHFREELGELSTYDNHPADEGSALYEREKDIALNEHYQTELEEIRRALEAIDKGTYGICEVCGKQIPFERLEALPTTTYCIEHSPSQNTSQKRPIEEEVIIPPYPISDRNRERESLIFDGEDAWQEVSSWGTSETPSDFVNPSDKYNGANEHVGYIEDFENFVGVDMYGNNLTVYPNREHEQYEDALDEEGIMTTFGDLHPFEREPYVEKEDKDE